MAFDPLRFRALVRGFVADRDGDRAFNPGDARGIVAIATLAANVDLDEVRDEAALLAPLADELCTDAHISPATLGSLSPLPLDKTERTARVCELAGQLTDARSRELAYVAAYVVAVADLELAPVESELLDELRQALALTDERAAELAEAAAQFLTPGVTPAMDARPES
jgi:hypothetical protein